MTNYTITRKVIGEGDVFSFYLCGLGLARRVVTQGSSPSFGLGVSVSLQLFLGKASIMQFIFLRCFEVRGDWHFIADSWLGFVYERFESIDCSI